MSRHFPSGRFGYAMGFKNREAAQDAFDSMCAERGRNIRAAFEWREEAGA